MTSRPRLGWAAPPGNSGPGLGHVLLSGEPHGPCADSPGPAHPAWELGRGSVGTPFLELALGDL